MAERIGIIGSGIMGAGIAQIAAQNGYEVIMTDVGQQQLDAAVGRITTGLDRGVQRGLFEQSVRDQAVSNLKTTLDLEEAAQAPLIIENIWEEQPAKEELLEKLDRMAPSETIWRPTHPRCPSLSWPPSPSGLTRSSGCTSSTHPTPCSLSR